jgi:hypothetical protein
VAGEIRMPKRTDCFVCGKEGLSRNEVGLNKKILNRNINKFHCLDCLSEYLDISPEDLLERIQEFKESGCKLFE